MNIVAKIILGIFGTLIGAIVLGLTFSFIIGPIDTGNSNVSDAIAEINTLLNQPEEAEMPPESESDNENSYESENDQDNGIRNIVRNRITNITLNDSDGTATDETEYSEDETPIEELATPHPIVGSWDTIRRIEIDIETTGSIAETTHFFGNGTGVERHSEPIQPRTFSWRVENSQLTITPDDTSLRITTHNFEISGNTLTIFYNRNRTSYIEAVRVN